MKEQYQKYLNKKHTFNRTTMIGIFCLLIVITGMFGWFYEFIFYFFNGGMKEFYWRGGNFLPWINIYATGSIMIYVLTYKYRKNPAKVFSISVISTGILEYFSGLGMYIIGNGMRCWNYNVEILNFGNIHGFVCLRSVLVFGVFALLLMYIVIPICFYLAKKINKNIFLTLSITLCSIIMFDEIYNLLIARILHLPRAYDVYKELGWKFVTFK
ncbi:MAG: putative ABC transporter permease [Bacilli bacterium]|nr:putative ABC transporter permease [Bacilli bacterium]